MSEQSASMALDRVRTGELVGDVDALPVPVFSGEQMIVAFAAYRQLQAALDRAMPDSIMKIEGRDFRRKAYWRAVAVAFHLQIEPVEERSDERGTFHDGRPNFGYHVTYRATTRTGRTVIGDGSCFAIEKARRFKCPHPQAGNAKRSEHWPHETCPDFDPEYAWRELPSQASDHNIRSHAHTRAFNRAVSNLVGFGEVSAEEMDRPADDDAVGTRRPPPPTRTSAPPPSTGSGGTAVISEPQHKRLWAIAGRAGWHEHEIKTMIGRFGFEHANEITRDKYEAIITAIEGGVDGTRGATS